MAEDRMQEFFEAFTKILRDAKSGSFPEPMISVSEALESAVQFDFLAQDVAKEFLIVHARADQVVPLLDHDHWYARLTAATILGQSPVPTPSSRQALEARLLVETTPAVLNNLRPALSAQRSRLDGAAYRLSLRGLPAEVPTEETLGHLSHSMQPLSEHSERFLLRALARALPLVEEGVIRYWLQPPRCLSMRGSGDVRETDVSERAIAQSRSALALYKPCLLEERTSPVQLADLFARLESVHRE